jgi:hypothetical protein
MSVATPEFSRDVMLGMLRKGNTGSEIMDILNVIVPESEDVDNSNTMTDFDGNSVVDF